MSIRERVRTLFLSPRDFYSAPEAAEIIGWSHSELTKALEQGELEGDAHARGTG